MNKHSDEQRENEDVTLERVEYDGEMEMRGGEKSWETIKSEWWRILTSFLPSRLFSFSRYFLGSHLLLLQDFSCSQTSLPSDFSALRLLCSQTALLNQLHLQGNTRHILSRLSICIRYLIASRSLSIWYTSRPWFSDSRAKILRNSWKWHIFCNFEASFIRSEHKTIQWIFCRPSFQWTEIE